MALCKPNPRRRARLPALSGNEPRTDGFLSRHSFRCQGARQLTSRRESIKNSGTAVAGAAFATTLTALRAGYCADDSTIKVALVGCGGRGSGAASNALSTQGPVKLWAMADVFEHRLEGSQQSISAKHTSQVFVPPERRFVGFDGCKHAIQRIHDAAIGDVITCWAYRMHGPGGFHARKPGATELAHQIANHSNFTWLNGSFLVDWLIHNIDVCCWAKSDWPESAQGMGGRKVREEADQLFDHYGAE